VRLIYIPSALFVHGNAAATASRIAGHESLFRFGIVSYLLSNVLWVFVILAFYRLLRGVDHPLAVMMVILGLMVTPIAFVNTVNDIVAMMFASGADFLSIFDKAQREAFVMLFVNLHDQLDLANDFWGLCFIPFGLLVYKSRFLPRILGIWLMVVCFAYLALSFTGLLFPGYEAKVFTIARPFLFGEVAVMFWLLVVGAKEKPLAPTSS
jgi:hypothetical protein